MVRRDEAREEVAKEGGALASYWAEDGEMCVGYARISVAK